MDKVIDKAVFDVVIQLVRDFWNSQLCKENELREDPKTRLEVIGNFLTNHFREYVCLYQFLQSTIATLGVNSEATNEQIYKALECLGWRIKGEEHVS